MYTVTTQLIIVKYQILTMIPLGGTVNNKSCIARLTIIDLNPYKLVQGCHHYAFVVTLDKCNSNFNNLGDPSTRIYISN